MEIKRLKALLGISENDMSQDVALQFVIDDVQETIINYCNLKTLPAGLEHTAYRMAMDLWRFDQPGEESAPLTAVSISEGDTSSSFSSTSDALAGGVLRDYRGQLNRYRKLR